MAPKARIKYHKDVREKKQKREQLVKAVLTVEKTMLITMPAIETIKKIAKGRTLRKLKLLLFMGSALTLNFLHSGNVHHRRQQAFSQVSKAIWGIPCVSAERLP